MLIVTFCGGGGGGGCNHLIATALFVCNIKQTPNPRVHTYQFSTCVRDLQQFFSILTKIIKTYVPIIHLLSQVSAFAFALRSGFFIHDL